MIRRPPRSTLFPTRRSSDLVVPAPAPAAVRAAAAVPAAAAAPAAEAAPAAVAEAAPAPGRRLPASLELDHPAARGDRKSTRLNSSHSSISYAVFCLKKKKKS